MGVEEGVVVVVVVGLEPWKSWVRVLLGEVGSVVGVEGRSVMPEAGTGGVVAWMSRGEGPGAS